MHALEIIVARNEKAQSEQQEKKKEKQETNIMDEKKWLMKQAYANWSFK